MAASALLAATAYAQLLNGDNIAAMPAAGNELAIRAWARRDAMARPAVDEADASRIAYIAQGFSSLYAEWTTVPAFRTSRRTFHESVRIPRPATPVRVALQKRGAAGAFEDLWANAVAIFTPAEAHWDRLAVFYDDVFLPLYGALDPNNPCSSPVHSATRTVLRSS